VPRNLPWIAAVCLVSVTHISKAATPPSDGTRTLCNLNVGSQELDGVLQEIARQCGVQMVYFSEITHGLRGPALKGRFTVDEALRHILDHTGLQFRRVNDGTVAIQVDPAKTLGGAASVASSRKEANQGTTRAPSDDTTQVQEVIVSGTAEGLVATRVQTPLSEIPQTISVISAKQIDQENETSLTDVLANTTGIVTSQVNSAFQTFTSRGFPITTYHVDGGAPLHPFLSAAQGLGSQPLLLTPDLGEFDHVEVLRGADALFGADGDPGGTVNLVRKRPLDTDTVTIDSSAGSWNNYHQEIDASGPLAFDGSLRGRMDAEFSHRDYFYGGASDARKSIFTVLEYGLTPLTVLTAGGSYTWEHAAPVAGGLPLFADATDPHLPRSTAYSFNWASFDTQLREVYAQLEQKLGANWHLAMNATVFSGSANYAIGAFLDPIDVTTDSLPSPEAHFTVNPALQRQASFEVTVTGAADWLGYHEAFAFGGDFTHTRTSNLEGTVEGFGAPMAEAYDYMPAAYPDPRQNPGATYTTGADQSVLQSGLFASVKVDLTPRWSVTAGLRLSDESITGTDIFSFGGPLAFFPKEPTLDTNKITPYLGGMFALNHTFSLYASYADIYQSNDGAADIDGNRLPPVNGIDMEGGLKGSWRDGALNGSVAFYRIVQRGIAEYDDNAPENAQVGACCFVPSGKNTSKGVDLEISGSPLPGWLIGAGYTNFNGADLGGPFSGSPLSTTSPRNLLKAWTSIQLPGDYHRWTIGGTLHAQSENSQFNYYCAQQDAFGECLSGIQSVRSEQTGYAIVSPRLAYEIDRHWQIALTINNLLDRRYYQTVGGPSGGNWYGDPLNFLVRIDGRY
jgi:outer membrane receptor for ferric coprogen and ferric-rhodotorulic acid